MHKKNLSLLKASFYYCTRLAFSSTKQNIGFDPRHSRIIIVGAGFSGLVASAYIPKIAKVKNHEIKIFDPKLNTTYKDQIESFVAGKVIFYNDSQAKSVASGLNQAVLFDTTLCEKRGKGLRQSSSLHYVTNTPSLLPFVRHTLRIQEILREKNID